MAVREPDGSGTIYERPLTAPQRTEDQLAAAMETHGVPRDYVLDHEPALGRIVWRPDGRLWVAPGGWEASDETLGCFDELSNTGELTRRVEIAIPGASPADELVLLEDGRMVLLRGFGKASEDSETEDLDLDVRPEVWLLEI